jgi:hypothetical protein
MANEVHPSPTARQGNIPSDEISRGIHADIGAFRASKEVWCKQCGFRCNLNRDIRNVDDFAGEVLTSTNELTNGSFEDWTGGSPDDWTLSGSVTQETTAGYFDKADDGVSSAKVVRSGSDISLSQAMSTPSDFNGNILNFRARVKSGSSEVIRLRVDVNGTSYYSNYNVAQQVFQDLTLVVICPVTASSLTVYILADSSDGTAYVDYCTLARNGNPITSTVQAGCPHCGSYNYF